MGKMQESALFVTLKYFEVGMRGEREREGHNNNKKACLPYLRATDRTALAHCAFVVAPPRTH